MGTDHQNRLEHDLIKLVCMSEIVAMLVNEDCSVEPEERRKPLVTPEDGPNASTRSRSSVRAFAEDMLVDMIDDFATKWFAGAKADADKPAKA